MNKIDFELPDAASVIALLFIMSIVIGALCGLSWVTCILAFTAIYAVLWVGLWLFFLSNSGGGQ